ncbi:MAG: hypothetical protein ABW196_09775 [Solirubrobacterales bacterium]
MTAQGAVGRRQRLRIATLALLAALLASAGFAARAGAEAPPPELWTKCEHGSGAGQCAFPRGIVADPASGNVFISDQQNDRVVEFTIWGEFVKTWGWDVVASGPDDDVTPPANQLETCVPANGDVCKAGLGGGGRGQLDAPLGIGRDAAGNIYVQDTSNKRVVKFDPAGAFVLMFGGAVNKTKVEEGAPAAQQNLCPVDPADVCQAGTSGGGDGEFNALGDTTANIGIAPGGGIFVGDKERIEEFEPNGSFKGSIGGSAMAGAGVKSIAVDPSGNLFVALIGKENVLKLGAAGEVLCTAKTESSSLVPSRAVAADGAGNLYVVDDDVIRKYSPTCVQDAEFAFKPGIGRSAGIAVSAACGIKGVDLYVSSISFLAPTEDFVRAFGSPPDPTVCPAPPQPPTVEDQHALSVGTDRAVVRARVNPRFWPDTAYYVQYGTADCRESPSACEEKALFPGAALSQTVGFPVITAGVELEGLQPGTTYYYRFVAQSSGGGPVFGEDPDGEGPGAASAEEGLSGSFLTYSSALPSKGDCPNQVFRTGSSAALPDCRAYEMVSPVDKGGGDVVAVTTPRGRDSAIDQSAADGEAITYSSYRAFGGPLGGPFTPQYLARRGSGGWSTASISPPQEGPSYAELTILDSQYKAFSEDLCDSWVLQLTAPQLTAAAVAGFPNLYHRQLCGPGAGTYEALTTLSPVGVEPRKFLPSIQGFSSEGSHAVFRVQGYENAPASTQLYEYDNDEVRLVCVLPNGTPFKGNCTAGSNNSNNAPTEARYAGVNHAISDDGSRIFWSDSDLAAGALYVRVNGEETIAVSKAKAVFMTAAPDGSRVIFRLPDASGGELHEYDVEAEEDRLIAKGTLGIMGAGEDAELVYLVSREVLTGEAPNSEGAKAEAGAPNLYLYQAGEEGGFTFLATLPDADFNSTYTPVAPDPTKHTSRVSPDGLHVAFMSTGSLTGSDNTDAASPAECGKKGGVCDAQVFLYGAESGELRCVSCSPGGARPAGARVRYNGNLTDMTAAAKIPTALSQFHSSRVLSADGSRLFFETTQPLVLPDTNDRQDVYEWEEAGSRAQCEALGAELFLREEGGCISLISSGHSSSDSTFVDADSSGRDVFFKTNSSLLSQDPGLIDIYDARSGGGFPPPPPARPGCQGESCQSPSAPPDDATPASSSFQGEGNQKPVQHKKKARGKKRRHAKHRSRHQKKDKRQQRAGSRGRAQR